MGQRTDTAKQFRVKLMGGSETFSFNDKDWEQAVIQNTGTAPVYLRDSNNIDFTVSENEAFNASTLPSKALSGMTVITGVGGAAQIAFFQ